MSTAERLAKFFHVSSERSPAHRTLDTKATAPKHSPLVTLGGLLTGHSSKSTATITKQQAMDYFMKYSLPWDEKIWELALAKSQGVSSLQEEVSESEVVSLRRLGDAFVDLGNQGYVFADNLRPKCPFMSQMQFPKPADVSETNGRWAQPDLLESIGGRDRLLSLTQRFYSKFFRDKHLSLFIEDTSDPHPERLADWLAERMSGKPYYSAKLRDRVAPPFDRSQAHQKAKHSFKRPAHQVGEHFKLDDSVTWMRLMFWSCREEGLDCEPFFSWYLGFIKHWIRVYNAKARFYTVHAAIWSLHPHNLAKYEADGWLMTDISGKGRLAPPNEFGWFV
jgi:truncated hemoglobin YjbI